MILREALRVGHRAVVNFPNWGYWRCRLELLLTGRIPRTPDLQQAWHEKPRWQALTVTDFARFCRERSRHHAAERTWRGRRVRIVKVTNLLSTTGMLWSLERRRRRHRPAAAAMMWS